MKKIITTLSLILLLTGCSKEKVLNCKKIEDLDGYKTTSNELITFNKDNVLKYDASIEVTLDKEYIKYKSVFTKQIESKFMEYNQMKGVKFTSKETDTGLSMGIKADVKEMDDSSLNKLKITKKASLKATKQYREKDGFKCK